jgi:thioredoxin reductase
VTSTRADVAVVGAGPAGLTAARELRRRGVSGVLVIERERAAGGIPRHADHPGFGVRDLRRVLSGPRYADVLADAAQRAGAELLLGTQVTGWGSDGSLEITGPDGRGAVHADAVLLATGCRERPRSARLVAGTRPRGVMTTGMLQQLVHIAHQHVGERAVVVGAEHVSFSALATLADGGARAVAMTTELPRHQSFAAFRIGAAARFRTPLHTRTAVSAIHGRERVEAVELSSLESGSVRMIDCDLVVFTADWIPDHELVVLAGADLDRGTRGPRVDGALRTTRPGVFAAGNVLHGAEAADVAALIGRHAAAAVVDFLGGDRGWPDGRIVLSCEPPLDWVVPGAVVSGDRAPARGRFLLRARESLRDVRIELRQDGRPLHSERVPRVMPGRSAALSPQWTERVDPAGGPVSLRVLSARRRQR